MIRNNILWGNAGSEIHDASLGVVTIQNCVIDGGYTKQRTEQTVANIYTTNPTLVNMSASPPDLHLTASSPCIDKGTEVPDLQEDYEGTSRPQRGGWDIGAYELTGPPVECEACNGTPGEVIVDNTQTETLSGWEQQFAPWSITTDPTYGEVLSSTAGVSTNTQLFRPVDTPDVGMEFSYVLNSGEYIGVTIRSYGLYGFTLTLQHTMMQLLNGNTMWSVKNLGEGSEYGKWYDIRVSAVGANVIVQRRTRGYSGWNTVLSTTTCPYLNSAGIGLGMRMGSSGSIDNLKVCRKTFPTCGQPEPDPDLSLVSPIPQETYQNGLVPTHWIRYNGGLAVSDSGDGNGNLALRASSFPVSYVCNYPLPNSGNFEARFSYKLTNIFPYVGGPSVGLSPRSTSTSSLGISFCAHGLSVAQNGPYRYYSDSTVTSIENQWYDVKMRLVGPVLTVWRRIPGCDWRQIYTRSDFTVITSTSCGLSIRGATPGDAFIDNLSVEELP